MTLRKNSDVCISVNCVGMYLSGKCRTNASEMFIKTLLLKAIVCVSE